MKKVLGLLVLVAIVAGCVWRIMELQKTKAAEGKKSGKGAQVPVLAAAVVRRGMPVAIRTFGAVEAAATVTIQPQVTGVLSELDFTEGQEVRRGDVLARLDARPFLVALHQAEAALERTQAQQTNAERDLRRIADLFAKGFVSENDRDQAATALAVLQASAHADAAAVESARIQLDYCTIRAPMDGRTGRRLLDVGNLAAANSTAIVTLNRLRPVRVTFAVPQAELARLREQPALQAITVDAILPDEPGRPERGALVFLDNAVDTATGTIALKAEFPNSSDRLWPGQFVDVRMVVSVETNALVIPYRAVLNGQQGTYVFVLNPAQTAVDVRNVRIARNVEDESIVAEGLQAGEFVVSDGQQLLGPGVAVQVKNAP
jgi:multidrug efflux system membrane fusion protein